MKKILTEAAAVGDATARAIAFHMPRARTRYYYANSNWQLPFIGGYKFQTAARRAEPRRLHLLLLHGHRRHAGDGREDGRPRLAVRLDGRDANGNPLDGGKNYKLHLPPNIPVKDFWSVAKQENNSDR